MAIRKKSLEVCPQCKGIIPINQRCIRRQFCRDCERERERKLAKGCYEKNKGN